MSAFFCTKIKLRISCLLISSKRVHLILKPTLEHHWKVIKQPKTFVLFLRSLLQCNSDKIAYFSTVLLNFSCFNFIWAALFLMLSIRIQGRFRYLGVQSLKFSNKKKAQKLSKAAVLPMYDSLMKYVHYANL